MSKVTIPNSASSATNNERLVPMLALVDITTMSLALGAVTSAAASFATTGGGSAQSLSADMDELHLKTHVVNNFALAGARFTKGGQEYVVRSDGSVDVGVSPSTGFGTPVGEVSAQSGSIVLSSWAPGGSPTVTNWRAAARAPLSGADTPYASAMVVFRTPTAPLRTGSFSLIGNMQDGTPINVTADSNGLINSTRIKGKINYTTGVVQVIGVKASGIGSEAQFDITELGVPGVGLVFLDRIQVETLRFNAVAYTYIPLDPDILGVDPVRLPTDGRVPIFRPGDAVVVGHTAVTSTANVSNGQTISTGRTRLSRVRVLGNNGLTINTGYTENLEAGTVTFTDVTGYSQPVRIEHRVEDMSLVRDAQINGQLTMLRPFTHDFPIGSSVSSAILAGDLRARMSLIFDQATWDGITYSDVLVGNAAPATYNDTVFPIEVENIGAINQRWALHFVSNTTFRIIGQHVGVVGEGSINVDAAPINPNTGEPYFRIRAGGWGTGWAIGNVVRFNTVGSSFPFWTVRTIKQGPAGDHDYSFSVLLRGDVDAP